MPSGASTLLIASDVHAVHVQDDHSSLWECVGLLLVHWMEKGEDLVRVSMSGPF